MLDFFKNNLINYSNLKNLCSVDLCQNEYKYIFLVTCFNCSNYIEKSLNSIKSQNYKKYEVIIIDDASTNSVMKKKLEKYESLKNWHILYNKENIGKLFNIKKGLEYIQPNDDDVIIILDGDDWLSSENVLNIVNKNYQTNDIWLTYGSYINLSTGNRGFSRMVTNLELKNRDYRDYKKMPWVFKHLLTFKFFLYKKIDQKDFYYNDEPIKLTSDQVITLPMVEMAGKHIKYIDEILYIYNDHNPLNDCKVNPKLQEDIDKYNRNKTKYNCIQKPNKTTFLNILIPYKDRIDHLKTVVNFFKQSINKLKENDTKYKDKIIEITVIEHNDLPTLLNKMDENINYIWLPLNSTMKILSKFNRGLCFNLGVLYTRPAEWYLCHDVDLISNFEYLNNLFNNMEKLNVTCLQSYSYRRVFSMTNNLTQIIQSNIEKVNNLNINHHEIKGNPPGSKGGSILVERSIYLNVGGHDGNILWGYAPEDQFFWDKLIQNYKVGYADNPETILYHMWHPPSHNTNDELSFMNNLFSQFKNLNKEAKLKIIELLKNNFKCD